MKRALLIAGGTIGGLGAVMAITPPNLSSTDSLAIGGSTIGAGAIGGGSASASSTPAATTSASAAPSKSATSKPVTTKKATATKSATAQATKKATASAKPSATNSSSSAAVATDPTPTPSATKTTTAPAPQGVTGTFVGPAVYVNYGTVQVQIVVKNGKITDATALQAPSGRNDRWTNMALPILKKQTLAAQSDAIQGASGASYTSFGWYKSLQGALAKAGL